MKKISFSLLSLALILSMVACKKDGSATSSSSISGTYNFVSLQANTKSTVHYNDGGTDFKSITYSSYTSTQNGGTVAFGGSTVSGTGITYTVNDTAIGYTYIDNVLIDSTPFPLNVTIPAVNSVSNYKLIGQDSIYFSGGSFLGGSGMGNTPSVPSGGKYTLSNGTLSITLNATRDTTIMNAGIPMEQQQVVNVKTILQKQ
jgi:hypothetical protein